MLAIILQCAHKEEQFIKCRIIILTLFIFADFAQFINFKSRNFREYEFINLHLNKNLGVYVTP